MDGSEIAASELAALHHHRLHLGVLTGLQRLRVELHAAWRDRLGLVEKVGVQRKHFFDPDK